MKRLILFLVFVGAVLGCDSTTDVKKEVTHSNSKDRFGCPGIEEMIEELYGPASVIMPDSTDPRDHLRGGPTASVGDPPRKRE